MREPNGPPDTPTQMLCADSVQSLRIETHRNEGMAATENTQSETKGNAMNKPEPETPTRGAPPHPPAKIVDEPTRPPEKVKRPGS
jgi:hypothetical protein